MAELTEKIVVSVAPAARHKAEEVRTGSASDISVMTPEEIAADVINCAKEGAAIVHMHVRDKDGKISSDITEFKKTIKMIRDETDIIIEGSTGGVSDLTASERGAVLSLPEVELANLNMGSVNMSGLPFINAPSEIKILCNEIIERNVIPVLELFEPGMIESVNTLIKENILKPPYLYAVSLGFEGSQPAKTVNLQHMVNLLPQGVPWYYQEHGIRDLAMCAAAIAAGARIVRVGFEDSVYYRPGKTGKTNAELVARLVEMIGSIGFDIASTEEARKITGIREKYYGKKTGVSFSRA